MTATSTDLQHRFRAMATTVEMRLVDADAEAPAAIAAAEHVVREVESTCTRFDPGSALMRANAAGRSWTPVPRTCFAAVAAAAAAHLDTDGLFDPRVLRTLTDLGYDRSLPFATGEVRVDVATAGRAGSRHRAALKRPWRPGLSAPTRSVRIGSHPIDLGGIGKGLAVRWAAARLRGSARAALVGAGGDVYAVGRGPEGGGWDVAVEDPFGGPDPVAVLRVTDRGVATSSTRIRSWTAGGRPAHHLIDPRTGSPATGGLAAVTVVDRDPATAEVWSKSLFVRGREGIRDLAESRSIAALWVGTDGRIGCSRGMLPHAIWKVHRVG